MSTDSDLTRYREDYDEFARTGGTDPTWYRRYSTVTRYLADVRQRLRSRPDDASLRPEDIPALPGWDIAEGDVEAFLEMIWRSVDHGVASLPQGRIYDQHWESINGFSHDGIDLTALTTEIIRDPEFETQNGRATSWFEAWREVWQAEGQEPRGRVPRGVIFRFIAALEPETYTSIADRDHLFRFARRLGLSSSDAGGSWYRMNELVLDRLQLPSGDPIMRNCYIWDLSKRLAGEDPPGPKKRAASYWAIAADPRRYDVVRAIAESDVDEWMSGGSALAPGDRVVFWKYKGSDQHRGIVGLGVVTSEPYRAPPSESPYWIKPPEDDEPVARVDVRYLRLPSGPIWLEDEPFLGELSVAKAQGGTTFKITPDQWNRLMEIVGGWPEHEARRVWWVNQRASFKEERAGGFLWAPLTDKAGRRPAHWQNMSRANAGDIVVSYAGGRIRALGKVLAAAVSAKQPEELEQRWNDQGELLTIQYADIDPIELVRIPVESRQAEGPGGPFNRTGGVNEGYLFPISDEFLERLAQEFPSVEAALSDLEGRPIAQRTWCIYVPRSGAANFQLARSAGTWGAPQEGRLTGVRPGDRLLFIHDLKSDLTPAPSGFPRVPLDLFHGMAGILLEADAVSGPFIDSATIWPNDAYPERLRFRELGEQREVPINTNAQTAGVVEATRRSALAGGRPILVEGVAKPVTPFDVEAVQAAASEKELRIDSAILAHMVAALDSGKHVILTGPPGTAKTTLAEVVAAVATKAGRCDGHVLTTATADWTTYETIGGLRPNEKGELTFEQGHFLDAIDNNEWLVIDELNRSNFDRAFGQLFTVLSGQAVELPYRREQSAGRIVLAPNGAPVPSGADVMEIPSTWRVIATMNVFDKSLLFEMSFALMRRFAFIEIPSPPIEVFEHLIDDEADGDEEAAALTKRFLSLRREKDVGPAIFMDMARFMRERRRIAPVDDQQLAFESFYSYLLPQFEGVDSVAGEHLYRAVKRLVGRANHERLRTTLNAVLGLELRAETSAREYAEQDGIDLDGVEAADEDDEIVA